MIIEIKLKDILDKFNITLDQYNDITEKFYSEKLEEVNDTVLTCIAANLFYELGIIQLRYIQIFSDNNLLKSLNKDFVMLSQLVAILTDIIRIPAATDVKQCIDNIKNWMLSTIQTSKEFGVNEPEITMIYRMTDPLFRVILKLEEILQNPAELNTSDDNIEEPKTTLLQ